MNILCIFYTQNRQTFQTKNHQECKSSVNFTLLISIRFSFPHKFSLCIFIKFLSSDLLKIIFYFFVSTSTFVPAIVRYQIFSFPVLSTFRKRKWIQLTCSMQFRFYDASIWRGVHILFVRVHLLFLLQNLSVTYY